MFIINYRIADVGNIEWKKNNGNADYGLSKGYAFAIEAQISQF